MNSGNGLTFCKRRDNVLRVQYIQLILPHSPRQRRRDPNYRMRRMEPSQAECPIAMNLLRCFPIHIVEDELVLAWN